jgi:hypothetical protein
MIDVRDMAFEVQTAWASPVQPRASLEAAGEAFARVVGFGLYTVTRFLSGGREVERIHSTNPEVYPVGGRKPVPLNAFTDRISTARRPFLAVSPAGFAPLFADHATITGLGLGAVMNLPIVFGAAVLGTVNLLDREGAYDESDLEPAMIIARQLLPALLAPGV